jgi:two-component system response regulator RegA
LVDGERAAREALARQFSEAGWSVATAASRAQALASSVDVPDCLVVDRDLVDGSGFNLFERLRAVNPDLCAVMMTRNPSLGAARPTKDPAKDPVTATSSLARVEWNHIQDVLVHSRGNVSEAARVLGLHRRSLQRKLRRSPGEAMSTARDARDE